MKGVELTTSLGRIAVRKIGEVLIRHVEDWLVGASEWAEESRAVIAAMKRKWQAEQGVPKPIRRSDRELSDFSLIRDEFCDGSGRGPELVVLPAGEFLMGSAVRELKLKRDDRAFDNEIMTVDGRRKGKRPMRIARRFALGRYPVTFEEYDAFLAATTATRPRSKDEADDHGWDRGRRPAINVSWHDAQAYCDWLNQRTGLRGDVGYRLPSEAEWEYACRAGTQTRRWWSDEWDPAKANGNQSFEGGKTSPVGRYAANAWGLHDMIGNVWEWCADSYVENIAELPADSAPYEGKQDSLRVLRGGSWVDFRRTSARRSAVRDPARRPQLRCRLSCCQNALTSCLFISLRLERGGPEARPKSSAQKSHPKIPPQAGKFCRWKGVPSRRLAAESAYARGMMESARRTGPALEAHQRFLLWLVPAVERIPAVAEIPARRPPPGDRARRA